MIGSATRAWMFASILFTIGVAIAVPGSAQDRPPQAVLDASLPPGITTYREIVERPLFTPNRRPAPETAVPDRVSGTSMVLMGVIVLPAARYAVIREGASPVRSVQEGAQLSTGIVERITSSGIEMRTADGTMVTMAVPMAGDGAKPSLPPVDEVSDVPHHSRPIIGRETVFAVGLHEQTAPPTVLHGDP